MRYDKAVLWHEFHEGCAWSQSSVLSGIGKYAGRDNSRPICLCSPRRCCLAWWLTSDIFHESLRMHDMSNPLAESSRPRRSCPSVINPYYRNCIKIIQSPTSFYTLKGIASTLYIIFTRRQQPWQAPNIPQELPQKLVPLQRPSPSLSSLIPQAGAPCLYRRPQPQILPEPRQKTKRCPPGRRRRFPSLQGRPSS